MWCVIVDRHGGLPRRPAGFARRAATLRVGTFAVSRTSSSVVPRLSRGRRGGWARRISPPAPPLAGDRLLGLGLEDRALGRPGVVPRVGTRRMPRGLIVVSPVLFVRLSPTGGDRV